MEIENILVGHREIQDAAVVGEPHLEFGEVPVAHVVPKKGSNLSAGEIIEYAAAGLAKYKRLARVVFVDTIPRSPSGKILRRLLRNPFAGQSFNLTGIGQPKYLITTCFRPAVRWYFSLGYPMAIAA